MESSAEIVNRVAQSPLLLLDLEDHYPQGERVLYDLKENLWQGLALKEKDFRAWLKTHDWQQYQDKYVALHCSTDAIIPTWAYMLWTVHATPYAKKIVVGTLEDLEKAIFLDFIEQLDLSAYHDKKVVVKGCSRLPVPLLAYTSLTARLQPIVQSLFFGEPCSTVPLYKRK
ncbi:MAG: DUF2480 family protein [Cytophagales bacterium]|nr:MAG: DUF2480 family protein [Cytophagales bacterium]